MNWANLPDDLLILISKRLQIEDYIAFRGVCVSWRSVGSIKHDFNGTNQLPWLMIKEDLKYNNHLHSQNFFNPLKNKFYSIQLTEISRQRCVESKGWLFTIDASGEMNLFHPFSRARIPLPHQATLRLSMIGADVTQYYGTLYVFKAVLSSSPITSDYSLMIIFGNKDIQSLAVWKPGYEYFKLLSGSVKGFLDLTFYKGLLLAICTHGCITVCNIDGGHGDGNRIYKLAPLYIFLGYYSYILESAGKILVIRRGADTLFQVYEFNIENRQCKRVYDLGNRAIFVGQNASFSVDCSETPGCKSNHIYFTENHEEYQSSQIHGGNTSRGIFSMKNGSIEPLGLSIAKPLIWVRPGFL